MSEESQVPADRNWWRGAVIYQIYPRSFQDSDGDGVGDLAGITQRLAYVASLGVDAVWISPFFPSPMEDFGYDVADYCGVDPLFGSLADFDALVAEASRLGIRVMIDLVLSHSSDRHPWFAESRADRTNPKADWYVWADPRPDGTPPNNWLSVFGGPSWAWDSRREQYYLHNFLASQPDLNLHNPEVQEAVLQVMDFWMARGVKGFRLDTINFYFHDQKLRSNPPQAEALRVGGATPLVNPHSFQDHIYDRNRPELLGFLRRMRQRTERYPGVAMVGEIGDSHNAMELMGRYTGGGDKLHMCYSFNLLSPQRPTGTRIAELMTSLGAAASDAWPCWAFSNHDVVRHASRWELDCQGRRLFAALLLSLRGSVSLYQGEELGLTEAEIPFERLQDPYGRNFWPRYKGRDGCRTPMVWTAEGGFSEAEAWLPIPPEHLGQAVAVEEEKKDSLLHFYRAWLDLRRRHPALARGAMEILVATEALLAFTRQCGDGHKLLCAFNLSGETQSLDLEGPWRALMLPGFGARWEHGHLTLGPFQAWLAKG